MSRLEKPEVGERGIRVHIVPKVQQLWPGQQRKLGGVMTAMNVILDLCIVPIGVGVSLSLTWPPVKRF